MFKRRARELFEGTGEALDPDDCAEHYGLYTAEGDRQLRTDEIPLQRALRGEQIRDVVLTVRPRRGSPRLVSVSGGPVTGRAGPQLGAVVVIHDVTARLAREDELRSRSAIAEHVADAVILSDAADGSLYANRAADEALRTADERFRRLFEDSPVGIALVSAEYSSSTRIPPCARSPASTATSW